MCLLSVLGIAGPQHQGRRCNMPRAPCPTCNEAQSEWPASACGGPARRPRPPFSSEPPHDAPFRPMQPTKHHPYSPSESVGRCREPPWANLGETRHKRNGGLSCPNEPLPAQSGAGNHRRPHAHVDHATTRQRRLARSAAGGSAVPAHRDAQRQQQAQMDCIDDFMFEPAGVRGAERARGVVLSDVNAPIRARGPHGAIASCVWVCMEVAV